MPDETDLRSVLMGLKSKRDKLSAAIEAIEELIDTGDATVEGKPTVGSQRSRHDPLKHDPRFDASKMSISEAARHWIKLAGRAQTATDIANALENAGFRHRSANFPNTVRSSLVREMKEKHTFKKVGKKWGVSESSTDGQP